MLNKLFPRKNETQDVSAEVAPLPSAETAGPVANALVPAARRTVSTTLKSKVASEAEIAKIDAFQGEILSAKGNRYELPESQRNAIVVLDNGFLVVSKEAFSQPVFQSAKTILTRNKFKARGIFLVDLNVVRRLNEKYNQRRKDGRVASVDDDNLVDMQQRIAQLVAQAAAEKCSDIRIRVRRFEAEIAMKIQGVYTKLYELPAATGHDLLRAFFVASDVSDASYRSHSAQSARVTDERLLPATVQSLRLEFTPLAGDGRHLAVRFLYSDTDAPDADVHDLGYAAHHIRQLKRMRAMSVGVNIICGPTGSGKSTTLKRSLTAYIRESRNETNVITIEDPPEYEIPGASQIPVANAEDADQRQEAFRKAIASAMRLDPDTIMIGEIRDLQSASLAFKAAMSGHSVWTTVHALDALSILGRLRDIGVEKYLLSDETLVTGLVAQRLVRTLCESCSLPLDKNPDPSLGEHRDILKPLLGDDYHRCRSARLQYNKGEKNSCRHCSGKGFSGRSVVAETILADETFMNFVRNDDKGGARNYWLNELAGMTMLEHGLGKMILGQVDPRDLQVKVGLIDTIQAERVPIIKRLLDIPDAMPAERRAIAAVRA